MLKSSVFITGAGSGLGLALAGVFLSEGWDVFAGTIEDSPELARLEGASKGRLTRFQLDVRNEDSVRAVRDATAGKTGSLEILINNAGINPAKDTPLEELDFNVVSDVLDVNALGPLRMAKHFLPLLEKGKLKRIIEISSEAGSLTDCTRTAWFGYCMSKTALNMQGRLLQNYLNPRGYSILLIHPGSIRSKMGGPTAADDPGDNAKIMYPMLTSTRKDSDPMYVQFDGKPLRW